MKEKNLKWKPLWFDFELEGKKVIQYKFNHKYWQCRKD